MDAAARAAAEILEGWAPILTGVELKTGSKGVFTVSLDGEVVFDKAAAGRKPNRGELGAILESRLGKPLAWRKT